MVDEMFDEDNFSVFNYIQLNKKYVGAIRLYMGMQNKPLMYFSDSEEKVCPAEMSAKRSKPGNVG
jgi:hypothetical protein